MNPRVLWLVTARSGSKGLAHKNICPLGGVPLLAWPILAARACGGTVWLSTDSPDYAAIGRAYGAEIPFLRPAALSGDAASSAQVCLHAMQHAKSTGQDFDFLGLLQPTSPFVGPENLHCGLRALRATPAAHAVVAVRHAQPGSRLIQPLTPRLDLLAQRMAAQPDSRRQAQPEEITPCGGFFIARWAAFCHTPTFYTESSAPVLLTGPATLDIDSAMDLDFAEFLLTTGRVDAPWLTTKAQG